MRRRAARSGRSKVDIAVRRTRPDEQSRNRLRHARVLRRQRGRADRAFSSSLHGAGIRSRGGRSARFFFEASAQQGGHVVLREPASRPTSPPSDFARYGANFIPRNAPVLAAGPWTISTTHVGFWTAQPDFRIPERLGTPTFNAFSDEELEAIYEDQVKTFVGTRRSWPSGRFSKTRTPTS